MLAGSRRRQLTIRDLLGLPGRWRRAVMSNFARGGRCGELRRFCLDKEGALGVLGQVLTRGRTVAGGREEQDRASGRARCKVLGLGWAARIANGELTAHGSECSSGMNIEDVISISLVLTVSTRNRAGNKLGPFYLYLHTLPACMQRMRHAAHMLYALCSVSIPC
jgi:hypothetical protein